MKKYLSPLVTASFLIFIISALVYFLCISFVGVADLVNSTLGAALRVLLSYATVFLPFSLFETLIILILPVLIFAVVRAFRSGVCISDILRRTLSLLSVILLILTLYIYTLGIGYHTTDLSQKIGLEDKSDIDRDELYSTALTVTRELNLLAEHLDASEGETYMPYSIDEMCDRLVTAYDTVNGEYSLFLNYDSRVKPVYFSTVMSDLGISGIYSFFTGEANVNVEYPDYCLPFTAAHEMAHQRGVCRENEANFVAFLVCIASDDPYIRYSGYLNMYEYLASAIYGVDPDAYFDLRALVHQTALTDMHASSVVYNEHKDSVLGKINDRLNDAYLKANGTEGVVSYGYVVRLAVAYYQNENNR